MENIIDKMLMSIPYFDIDPDNDTTQVSDKGDYVPILSRVGNKWQLYWSDGENYFIPVEEENTPIEAIQNAYDYCLEKGWIKEDK
jgi:hypothetical protein